MNLKQWLMVGVTLLACRGAVAQRWTARVRGSWLYMSTCGEQYLLPDTEPARQRAASMQAAAEAASREAPTTTTSSPTAR